MRNMESRKMTASTRKVKSIKDGDAVEINGSVFRVDAVRAMEKNRGYQLELQAPDGGLVTFIGVPGARLRVASRDDRLP